MVLSRYHEEGSLLQEEIGTDFQAQKSRVPSSCFRMLGFGKASLNSAAKLPRQLLKV